MERNRSLLKLLILTMTILMMMMMTWTLGHKSPSIDRLRPSDTAGFLGAIDRALEQLPLGQVMFNPPETMKVGRKERIEVRISRSLTEDLTRGLRGSGVPQIETVKVSALMRVRLLGDAFEIVPLNEDEQIVTRTGFTQWAWDVTPLKAGWHELHLVVSVKLRLAGVEKLRDYPVIDRVVYVKVNPGYALRRFFKNNWQWLLTAIIIPLVVKSLRDFRKQKKKQREEAEKNNSERKKKRREGNS